MTTGTIFVIVSPQFSLPRWRNWQTCRPSRWSGAGWPAGPPAGREQAGARDSVKSMFTVYVIQSILHHYRYVGLTDNLKRRINQHQEGKERTTAPYRRYKLIYTEVFLTRAEARKKEKYLKSGFGRKWLDKNFSG